MKKKSHFGGAFFTDADALRAFKGREFGGEAGIVIPNTPLVL